MTAINDTFLFTHAMEIRLLLAVGAIAAGFALIKVAAFVAEVAHALRVAVGNPEAGQADTSHLSAIGIR